MSTESKTRGLHQKGRVERRSMVQILFLMLVREGPVYCRFGDPLTRPSHPEALTCVLYIAAADSMFTFVDDGPRGQVEARDGFMHVSTYTYKGWLANHVTSCDGAQVGEMGGGGVGQRVMAGNGGVEVRGRTRRGD